MIARPLLIFRNAAVTFGLPILPLFIAGIVFMDAKERSARRIARWFFFSGVVVNCFFILLLGGYYALRYNLTGGISGAFLKLCGKINVKFLAAAFVLDAGMAGMLKLLKQGKISIRSGNIPAAKPLLALVFASIFLIDGSFRFREIYGLVPVEQLLFHVMMPESGANFSIVYALVRNAVLAAIILFVLMVSLLSVNITFGKQRKTFRINISGKIQRWGAVLFSALGLGIFIVNMGFPAYIASRSRPFSTFYEEQYIDPGSVAITFPERRRNLIVIFIESLETGFLARESGGAFSERLMPATENLLRDNINFSAADGPGGAHQLDGTGWTVAGITAQYSGVPLNLGFEGNSYGQLLREFIPGASGVGDILRRAGYKNYFLLGSEIEFGGRDKYFATHGNTVIYDYHYFLDNGYVPARYHDRWWGIEDRKLYGFAKEKLLEIAPDGPFFFTLLTTGTHAQGGYLDGYAANVFDSRYKNVLFDTDRQLSGFLSWLAEQDFYENTTVAVLGDHLYMDASVFPEGFDRGGHNRFPLNIFINSLLREEYAKNRVFSHFDMFPALIDSVGGEYAADGFALGRSMNKGAPTLLERFGADYVNDTLRQKSVYYNNLWIAESRRGGTGARD